MSTQHTRGPYTVGTDTAGDAGPGRIHVLAQSNVTNGLETVAIASTVANAIFIVRACNAHDELLAALRQCEAFIAKHADMYALYHPETQTQKALTAARAAITKAEGRS